MKLKLNIQSAVKAGVHVLLISTIVIGIRSIFSNQDGSEYYTVNKILNMLYLLTVFLRIAYLELSIYTVFKYIVLNDNSKIDNNVIAIILLVGFSMSSSYSKTIALVVTLLHTVILSAPLSLYFPFDFCFRQHHK